MLQSRTHRQPIAAAFAVLIGIMAFAQAPIANTYKIDGHVKRPGSYPVIRENTGRPVTVLEAINDAGGFLDGSANREDILIVRGNTTFHFSYRSYLRGENRNKNISLQDGDTVLVK